jgi:glutamate racemase
MLPDMLVLGVVSPGAKAAVAATKNQRIAVLATETTIAANAYQRLITDQLPKAVIYARACSLLVALAEEGMVSNHIARATLEHYLLDIKDEDTILLGCTHFPVFKSLISSLLPARVSVVDSADATALTLRKLLAQGDLLSSGKNNRSDVLYLVTDSVNRFQKVGEIFLAEPLLLADIELVDV